MTFKKALVASVMTLLVATTAAAQQQPTPPPPPQQAPREPSMASHQPARAPVSQRLPQPSAPQLADPALDDDQLEIPAFLRRQAN